MTAQRHAAMIELMMLVSVRFAPRFVLPRQNRPGAFLRTALTNDAFYGIVAV